MKALEAARYAKEQELAQKESAEEKQRRKEAYIQCVPCPSYVMYPFSESSLH